jgi:hypothetical protein
MELSALRCSQCGTRFGGASDVSAESIRIRGRGFMQILAGLGLAGGCLVLGVFFSLIFAFLSPGSHFRASAAFGGIGILIAVHGAFRIAGTMETNGARLLVGLGALLVIGGGYILLVLTAPFE